MSLSKSDAKFLLKKSRAYKKGLVKLIKTGSSKEIDVYYGLCYHIDPEYNFEYVMQNIFEKWKYFSGCRQYPIKSNKKNVTEYMLYHASDNKYDTKYKRKMRLKLVNYLIKVLKKKLK